MGKKGNRGNKHSAVPHREAFMRMNFLLQASMAVLSANPAHPELSRFYVHTMRSVGKRLVLRMDPSLKRMVCKSCDTLLIPGLTATHRVRARRERHVVVRCLTCGNVKRFLARVEHQLWSENPTNVAQPIPTTGEPLTTATPPPTTTAVPNTTTTAPPPSQRPLTIAHQPQSSSTSCAQT